jgi:chromosome partitioning protein
MAVVVAFVSQKGGVGKSTLARALLAVAAHSMNVRLADLDPQQASVVAWERARHRNRVVGPPCEVIPYRSFRHAIAASSDADLLIVDTPARTSRATLEIAKQSHLVVQPTGASADDLQPAILTFHELVKEGVPKDRLAIAICRILSDGEEETVRAYVQDAGYAVLPGAIPERIAYREAQNRGRAITETTAKLNAQADALIDALMKRVTVEIKRASKVHGKRVEHK